MKVLSVLRAESVRAVRTIGGTFGYLPDALSALTARYGFVGLPTPNELLPAEPATGITFKHGKLESDDGRSILIDFLQVFPNGLTVITRSNTSDSDIALDDIMAWAKSEFKIEFEPLKPGLGHSSQLEVRLDKSLSELLPFLSEVGAAITKGLDDFWEFRPSYECITVNFWSDKTKYPAFAPPIFRIDRRDNVPFEQNVYYCEAPMSTDNHIAALSRFERICLETFK